MICCKTMLKSGEITLFTQESFTTVFKLVHQPCGSVPPLFNDILKYGIVKQTFAFSWAIAPYLSKQ